MPLQFIIHRHCLRYGGRAPAVRDFAAPTYARVCGYALDALQNQEEASLASRPCCLAGHMQKRYVLP